MGLFLGLSDSNSLLAPRAGKHRPNGQHLSLAVAAALLLPVSCPSARAQTPNPGSGLPNPRLFTITPCGGQLGQTLEVSFTGTDVEEPESLLFSAPGIRATPIVPPPPPPPDPKAPAGQAPPKPVVTKFTVSIPVNTPLGIHDVRLVNKWGVSNPRAFVVGDLLELLEKEPNNEVEQAQRLELNSTVNGNMAAPTDVDYFVFAAKKGQRVVVHCSASSIDSRFQPGLELYDRSGRQLAFNRLYDSNDALTDLTVPADGDYLIRLFEFTHTRGSPEHFYRLSVSTAPWIDCIVPPVVEPGKANQLVIYGRNLPGGIIDPTALVEGRPLEKLLVTVNAPASPPQQLSYSGCITPSAATLDGMEYQLRNSAGTSNPYLLSYARAPVIIDNGDNDTAEKSQEVALPCDIAGRIEKKQDRDWYIFQAKQGEVWNIELLGDRIGAPADLFMTIRNPATKQDLADLDDTADTLHAVKFVTRTADPPRHRFVAPADGKYQILVSSREANVAFGPRHIYVIRAVREQPDFRLFVLPSDDFRPDSCQLAKNGEQFLHVLGWRLDGFAGPITTEVEGLPAGVTAPSVTMAANLKQISVVLSAPAAATPGNYPIKIKGTATINGQTVVREARHAHIVWPGQPGLNLPLMTRLARGTIISIREQPPYRVVASLDKASLFQGEKANLKLTLTRHSPEFKTPMQAIGIDLPPNLLTVNNNQPVSIAPDKTEATAVVDAKANLPPGKYTIVVRTSAQMPYNKDPNAKQKPNINLVLPSTPVTIMVFAKQVATLSLPAPSVTAKAGAQTDITVKLTRTNDYAGEFKVQIVPPANVKGLSASEVIVPAGKDEAKLSLQVAADMPPANVADVIIRATAMQDGTMATIHEAKLAVTVVK